MSQKSGERRKELARKRRRREQSLKLRAKETKPLHKKKQENDGNHNGMDGDNVTPRPLDHFPGLGGHTAKFFSDVFVLKTRELIYQEAKDGELKCGKS